MILHKAIYNCEPLSVYMYLRSFEISHYHDTRISLRCKEDKLLLKKPEYKKKMFLARAFITRAIDIWNNVSIETKNIAFEENFKSAVRKQMPWLV